MHERKMGEVAQIVDDQQPVCPIVHISGKAAPFAVCERRIIDDQIWIGFFGIAHPDPDQVITFDAGIASDAELRRNLFLAGNLDAFSARIELHAVVHASDIVAFDPAHRERCRTMATAVVQRDDFAAGSSVNNDRPLQNGPGQLLAVDQFVIPGRNVPGIAQKNSVVRHHILRVRGTLSFY